MRLLVQTAVLLAQLEWDLYVREPGQESSGCLRVRGSVGFQFSSPEGDLGQSIAVKELAPIVMACADTGSPSELR